MVRLLFYQLLFPRSWWTFNSLKQVIKIFKHLAVGVGPVLTQFKFPFLSGKSSEMIESSLMATNVVKLFCQLLFPRSETSQISNLVHSVYLRSGSMNLGPHCSLLLFSQHCQTFGIHISTWHDHGNQHDLSRSLVNRLVPDACKRTMKLLMDTTFLPTKQIRDDGPQVASSHIS